MKTSLKIAFTIILLCSFAGAKEFTASFGNGGMVRYKVVDNVCYGYAMEIKDNKTVVKFLNQALTVSIQKARNSYKSKGDGFINIRHFWTTAGKSIFYQICGDIVKKK